MLVYSTKTSDYVFFQKSGHTLLKTVFRNVFLRHFIDFSSYQAIKPDSEKFKEKQKFLFVRNPINRFFSSFYFFDYTKSMKLDDYIKNFNITLKQRQDGHLQSQYECLTFKSSKTYSSIENYFNEELGKYQIIKIEDIDRDVELFKKSLDFTVLRTGSSNFLNQ